MVNLKLVFQQGEVAPLESPTIVCTSLGTLGLNLESKGSRDETKYEGSENNE